MKYMKYRSDDDVTTFTVQKSVYGDCRDCIYYDKYFESGTKYLDEHTTGLTSYDKEKIKVIGEWSYCGWAGEYFSYNGYGRTCSSFESRWGTETVVADGLPILLTVPMISIGGGFFCLGIKEILNWDFSFGKVLFGLILIMFGVEAIGKSKNRIKKYFTIVLSLIGFLVTCIKWKII